MPQPIRMAPAPAPAPAAMFCGNPKIPLPNMEPTTSEINSPKPKVLVNVAVAFYVFIAGGAEVFTICPVVLT